MTNTQSHTEKDVAEIAASDVYFDPEDIVAPDFNAKPWPKACSECAFHPHDPQHLGAEVRALLRSDVASGDCEFYCVHRLSKRRLHRVCASAAAIRRNHLISTPDMPKGGEQ
jgi:hypothetical protein